MRRWRLAWPLALALAAPVAAQVPEPDGYRGPPYEAVVPETLRGAAVIDAVEALRLHDAGVAFVDVYPRTARPAGLPEGTLWRGPVHLTIPGAIWAPGTGYDVLSADETARLERALSAATGGDRAHPVVVFCRADCWMSWNAAKRAVALGYSAVRWFPDGTDGWEGEGGMLEPAGPPED